MKLLSKLMIKMLISLLASKTIVIHHKISNKLLLDNKITLVFKNKKILISKTQIGNP